MCWIRKPIASDVAFEDVQVDIRNNPWSTVNDIVSRTQWSRGTVSNVIRQLREDRAVSRSKLINGVYVYHSKDL